MGTSNRLARACAALLAAAVTAGVPVLTAASAAATSASAAPSVPQVRVVGNRLVDQAGRPVRLVGVDRAGSEYACAQGWGTAAGPVDAAAFATVRAWPANAVRVPLNEDCWLGINGSPAAFSGVAYRSAIRAEVDAIHANGMVAILDLHWNAPGGTLALSQQMMADRDHSPAFWTSVATAYKDEPGVIFDLYNEPHSISWDCWANGGCTVPARGSQPAYVAAGIRELLAAVRGTGATNPVMIGGLGAASDLSGWLAHVPPDPAGQEVASLHVYNFGGCAARSCWDGVVAPVAARVPVVVGELGENDCAGGWVGPFLDWLDAHGVSYLAWAWNTARCTSFPALISGYDGTPTGFGAGVRAHFAAVLGPADGRSSAPDACPPGTAAAGMFADVPADDGHRVDVACASAWGLARGAAPGRFTPGGPVTREQMASLVARLVRAGGGSLPSAARHFADVPATDPHAADVAALTAAGIVRGTPNGGFAPARPVSRNELAALLVRAYGYRTGTALPAGDARFSDEAGDPLAGPVAAAAAAGFVRGYGDGTFHPTVTVDREQAASFLVRALDRLVREGHTAR